MNKSKLIYLITEDWFFCSHFMDRALAAMNSGYEVVVAAREGIHAARIRSMGMNFVALEFERKSINPFNEIRLLISIWMLYRKEKPAIVHHVAIKPIIYGSIAAKLSKRPAIINAPVGMGYIFSSIDVTAWLLKPLLRLAYRFLINPKRSKVIFENKDDLGTFVRWGAVKPNDAVLIRGAGVNLTSFAPSQKAQQLPVVMLIARMLRDKGVGEFVTAAQQINKEKIHARFILVGNPDPGNPASYSIEDLRSWEELKGIEWWGWQENIAEVLRKADVVCLPSYREGLPKSLLEAAACGLPIVTTDAVGCREVVEDGSNGFLVPIRNVKTLANALRSLIEDADLRRSMGHRSRLLAEKEFSTEKIVRETLAVYSQLTSNATGQI
jgi:glycosyltransferase involved in cell wall biosynthesis